MLKRMCKASILIGLNIDFIVYFDEDEVHAIDGFGNGIIILIVHGHFLVSLYVNNFIL